MRIEPIDFPDEDRSRNQRYNQSPKGKARRTKYRHERSKWETDESYLSRRIVGIDGEGVTRDDGSHDYIMLAVDGQSSLRNPGDAPLSIYQILTYLYTRLNPADLNVIYGGGYDWNMWLKGLSRDKLLALYNGGFLSKGVIVSDGFVVNWTRGKKFVLRKAGVKGRTITIYDTVAFFQCPFVDALDDVLKEYEGRDFLIRQKAARGTFDIANSDEISRYNNLEVQLLGRLIGTLREHLNAANLRPSAWYGPGALATAVMRREGIHDAMADTPDPVRRAARFAYAGGRFEMFKYGDSDKPVWEYDINSAYPAAIQHLPNLQQGDWIRHDSDVGDLPFALYHVTIETFLEPGMHDVLHPGPMFYRFKNGSIAYPPKVTGWVWSPELEAIRGYFAKYGGELTVHEIWEFKRHPGSKLPFTFVGDMYAKRQNAKRAGEGVQIAYKLTLNSLYGKLAQQVGYVPATKDKPAKKPPYHQIEWAGYVTSYCRALLLKAITMDRDAVIAVETDALFTTHPLPLPLNDGLGAWKETRFENLTYVQSGHYYADEADDDGNVHAIVKCRGVDKGSITRADVQEILQSPGESILPAHLTRFIGAGQALMRGMEHWCRWERQDKQLSLFPTGKRVHPYCDACLDDGRLGREWHSTLVPIVGGRSHEFPIAWENPNPNMTQLEELRGLEPDYEL